MAHYIDKDAVLAEIRKLHDKHISPNYIDEAGVVLEKLEDAICLLEVKEADFEKIWKEYFKISGDVAAISVKPIAKHFFELGLRASLTEEKYKGNVKGSYTTTTEFKK